MVQDGSVEQVLQPRLEMAVEVGHRQHALILLLHDVAVPFQNDVIHGQGAGLVGAENVHGSEVLDGVEPFDNDPPARHRDGAVRQAHGHDHRQHLRRQADRDGQGEEKGLPPVPFGQPIDDEHQRHHHEHEADHQPGELTDTAVETGLGRLLRDDAGHAPQVGVAPGGHDHTAGRAALDAGAKEAEVPSFQRRAPDHSLWGVGLFDGERLAGQAGLDDVQVLAGDQAQVGRDHVARGQSNHVAGHQVRQGDLAGPTAADHCRRDADHGLELGGRSVGAGLLPEAQADS